MYPSWNFVLLGYYAGSAGMKALLNVIPQNIIDGLQVAANMLPAIGFAILLEMIINKTILPYFFLGFLLSAYLKVPVLGVALFGLIIVIVKFHSDKKQTALDTSTSTKEDTDYDDDF
ncbi:PTS sugar transporter subunit IIC [Lactobacillus sp. R2/2]|nr:PTS sugar transporter subunit IIC [Lactobacillus sp. R2/2]